MRILEGASKGQDIRPVGCDIQVRTKYQERVRQMKIIEIFTVIQIMKILQTVSSAQQATGSKVYCPPASDAASTCSQAGRSLGWSAEHQGSSSDNNLLLHDNSPSDNGLVLHDVDSQHKLLECQFSTRLIL